MPSTPIDQSQLFDNGNGIVLNIGIVGAGVAGLTAAAILSRIGHRVDVCKAGSLQLELYFFVSQHDSSQSSLHLVLTILFFNLGVRTIWLL